MSATSKKHNELLEQGSNSDRVQFFSDAVFAIAMTLLVIDLTVPMISGYNAMSDAGKSTALWQGIRDQSQQFLAYGIGFYILAVNWIGHHNRFRVVRRYDSTTVTLNLVLLFFVAFVPYPVSLISEYSGEMPSVILFAGIVSVLSILQFATWSYSFSKGYLDKKVDLALYRFVRRNMFVSPMIFLVSIPVGFIWGGDWAMYFWILNLPFSRIVAGWEPKSERLAEAKRAADAAEEEKPKGA
ncbi:hypothetical protein BH09ACT1_BH09ACT1_17210 [soil metagenome]